MRTLIYILLISLLSCGSDDGEGPTDTITEIIPAGYKSVSSARISHDGTKIAMVVDKDDKNLLIVTSLTGEDIQVLDVQGLDYLSTLAWSSDDSAIYFSGDGIARVALSGTATEVVVDAFAVSSFDLAPDDKTIAWSTNGGRALNIGSLSTLPVKTAESVQVTGASEPRFSADNKKILIRIGGKYHTVEIDGENLVEHVEGAGFLSNGAWMDEDSFLFLANDKINSFDLSSKKTTVVNADGFAAKGLDYSQKAGKYTYLLNGQKSLKIAGLR